MSHRELSRVFCALHRDQRGQAGFSFILSIVVGFALLSLGFDTGLWYLDHRVAQTQAEAAALAAFQPSGSFLGLPATAPTGAIDIARQWLVYNGARANGDICPGFADVAQVSASPAGGGAYDTVTVCIRRPSAIVFSGLANVLGVSVSASATARGITKPLPYAVMAMRGTDCSGSGATKFSIGGGAKVTVNGGGGTYTAAPCNGALSTNGGGTLSSGQNDVVGTGTGGGIIPAPTSGVSSILDPYSDLAQPVPGACVPLGNFTINDPTTLSPGTYCQSLAIHALVTLNPGVYIFRQGFDVSGSGGLTGDANDNGSLDASEEVLLYSTCTSGSQCNAAMGDAPPVAGDISLVGTGTLNLRGISGPTYKSMLIWIDRTSGQGPTLVKIAGGANVSMQGRLYAVSSYLQVTGGGSVPVSLNMSFVTGSISFTGTTTFTVPYDPALAPAEHFVALVA